MLPIGTRRCRCVVLVDGSAIGCYQRNTHETHTIVLEPSGHAYSYIQPDGTRTRHLTPTALSSHRPLVLDILNLRNRFTDQAPYLHVRLMEPRNIQRQRRIRALRARWPASEGKTNVSRLFNAQDKCFEMQSIEGAAKVRLHISGKLVELFYIVEVKVSEEAVEESSSHAHYATLCRVCPVGQTPKDFDLPVRVLLAAKAAWDKDQEAEIEYDGAGGVSELPGNGAFAARPAFSVIATSTDGVQVDGDREGCLSLAEILRVSTLPSKLLYNRVVAEAIGDDTTLIISKRALGQLPEIVQLACERSLLIGCDGFFTWHDAEGQPQRRFTRDTIPPPTTIDTKNHSNSVTSLCQHMSYVENDHGRFRAFRDGRIRVAFADRTILQVERDGECCSFFFPDGSLGQTTLASAPLRNRTYIYQALEFGDWAFASQEERMQRHEKRQEAEGLVARELQRISVRFGMNCELGVYRSTDVDEKPAVRDLQAATLAHIASVDHVLQTASSAAASGS
eukprot:jgi/Phyca11/130493/e_gw1.94.23.1